MRIKTELISIYVEPSFNPSDLDALEEKLALIHLYFCL